MPYIWVSNAVVLALHEMQLAEHGGKPGLRDEALLESALSKPKNLVHYDDNADLAAIAAAYGFGIAKNHPFIDGNKRASFVTTELFLNLNGAELTADDADSLAVWLSLASGQLTEEALAAWIRQNLQIDGDMTSA